MISLQKGLVLVLVAVVSRTAHGETTMSSTPVANTTEAMEDVTSSTAAVNNDNGMTTASSGGDISATPTVDDAGVGMTEASNGGVTDGSASDDTTAGDSESDSTDAPGATDDPDATDEPDDNDSTDAPSEVSEEPEDNNNSTDATDEPDSAEATSAPDNNNDSTSAPGGNTGGGGDDDNMSTQSSENVTRSGMSEPDMTTSAGGTSLMCYECNGDGCDSARTNAHLKCTSTVGICFMTFDLSNSTSQVTRSCNSTIDYKTACGSTYPSGSYANDKCEFCCNTDKCNGIALTAATCEAIRDSGARGRHSESQVVCLAAVMAAVSLITQRLIG